MTPFCKMVFMELTWKVLTFHHVGFKDSSKLSLYSIFLVVSYKYLIYDKCKASPRCFFSTVSFSVVGYSSNWWFERVYLVHPLFDWCIPKFHNISFLRFSSLLSQPNLHDHLSLEPMGPSHHTSTQHHHCNHQKPPHIKQNPPLHCHPTTHYHHTYHCDTWSSMPHHPQMYYGLSNP